MTLFLVWEFAKRRLLRWQVQAGFIRINLETIKTSFFLTSSIARQKDHNNLLPLVRVGLNLVCFARGMTLMAAFIVFTHEKCFSLCSSLTFVGRI